MTRPFRVYIVNLGRVVSDAPVTGTVVHKVLGSMFRYLWYLLRYDMVVLAAPPPPAFVRYTQSLGLSGRFYVPTGLNLQALDILDGFDDFGLRMLLDGAEVDSYVPDERLAAKVADCGGTYLPCVSNTVTDSAGAKTRFTELAAGAVGVPPGVTRTGSDAIAREVRRRALRRFKPSFIRYDRAGGGVGNRQTPLRWWMWWWYFSLPRIIRFLENNQPELWRNESALVEDVLKQTHSFGVAFEIAREDIPARIDHTTLQITRHNDFVGAWLPCPRYICPPGRLTHIVCHFGEQLSIIGFWGRAQIDLGWAVNRRLRFLWRIWRWFLRLVGYEVNARGTGGLHAKYIGELLHGPYETWEAKGVVVRSVDVVHLRKSLVRLTFEELHQILDKAHLLATLEDPCGVVVSMPPSNDPNDQTVALVVVEAGEGSYERADATYAEVLRLIGHPTLNQEDRPL
jgi:hypothetical protein